MNEQGYPRTPPGDTGPGERQEARFGFEPVPASEKQARVNAVFSRVADKYDLMNDLMSGGLHRLWKDELIGWLNPPRGDIAYRLVDVAGGTGDIARRFLAAAGARAECLICDISGEMLKAGRARLQPPPAGLSFIQANAESLPLADASCDAYTIGFGIRNVTHMERALSEAWRVLRPGGRFLCLEFSQVQVPILDSLYERYSFGAIPALGGLVAGDAASYRYLVESIRNFPDQDSFADMVRAAGFERVSYRNLTGGIAAIHSGWRL
ncbi:MAG: bifunctional demethylmenaquinone methyltransferase/2-methoxy-6-polyprenyl-1,4-benzoquinol methylase UbiE [Methyloligellaceae bacterium]